MKLGPIPSLISGLFAVAGFLHAAPLVDDGFDYEPGGLNGASGGTGFTGAWSTVKVNPQVVTPGLSWGSLEVAGNSVSGPAGGGGGARDIGATSVLDGASLMGNGETLWFSVVLGLGTETVVNVDFNLSLGTDGFANYTQGVDPFARRLDLQSGEGIGFALSSVNPNTGRIDGAYWQDDANGADADAYADRVKVTGSGTLERETSLLIVGKIEWGADDLAAETLTLYAPDTSLNLGTPILAATSLVALDQSAFDTVAFQLKGGSIIDEIRFGASAADVLPAAVIEVAPRITSITSVGTDLWELTLEGQGETAYEFRSSTDLVFDPGTLVENLSQADEVNDPGTVGGPGNTLLTTNSDGDATVRMMLTGPKNFIRAQLPPPPPPLLDEGFEDGDGGFTVSTPEGTTLWAHGDPDSTDEGGVPNPGGSVTEGHDGSTNCWGTDIGNPGFYTNPTHTCLRSPVLDLTGVTAAELSFAMALDLAGGDEVTVNIIADTTDTPFATDIIDLSDSDSLASPWELVGPVSIPAAALGERVRIEWCLTATGTSLDFMGWYIDDVLVEDTSP